MDAIAANLWGERVGQGNRMTLLRVKHLCEVAVVPSRLQALALYSSLAARLVSQ